MKKELAAWLDLLAAAPPTRAAQRNYAYPLTGDLSGSGYSKGDGDALEPRYRNYE